MMQKCIIIPDSFKGTLSSKEACSIMKKAVLDCFPLCEAITIPIADGGEGTVECFLEILPGEIISVNASGPYFEPIQSFYGKSGDLGIVEMAAAAGLSLGEGRLNPEKTSTFGVGQLIKQAISDGCKKILVGLGGSCTNDAGAGAAAALGVRFSDEDGREFVPVGGTLDRVKKIDTREAQVLLNGVDLVAICDIKNHPFGDQGAAFAYAPQKGADAAMVRRLDLQLRAFSETIRKNLEIDIACLDGGAAAGAMGGGMYAMLGARLEYGIDTILQMVGFESLLSGCDYVFTGEGSIDMQSADGKTLSGIGKISSANNVPVIAFAGKVGDGADRIYRCGIKQIIPIHPYGMPPVLEDSATNLYHAMRTFLST